MKRRGFVLAGESSAVGAVAVDRAPDTGRLYLTYWGVSAVGAVDAGSRLLVLSAQSGRTERVVQGCRTPHHVAVATPLRTVAACNASGTLAIFGPRGVLASVRVGAGPHGVAIGRI